MPRPYGISDTLGFVVAGVFIVLMCGAAIEYFIIGIRTIVLYFKRTRDH